MTEILKRSFYARETTLVAQELLGKIIVFQDKKASFKLKIVETEAYLQDDPASHAYKGKTKRNEPMFGDAGFTYVYLIYGMYYCLNFVTEAKGIAGAVLIRAAEPLLGITEMLNNRNISYNKISNIANGPGKLCQSLGINKEYNKLDLCLGEKIYVCSQDKIKNEMIVKAKRIGLREKEPKLLRFYIAYNKFVSLL